MPIKRQLKAILMLGMSTLAACQHDSYDPTFDYLRTYMILNLLAFSNEPMQALREADYQAMSNTEKYRTINKLYATIFTGAGLHEVFDIQNGLQARQLKLTYKNFITGTRIQLRNRMSMQDRIVIEDQLDDYQFDKNNRERILARLYFYPISKDRFDMWMTYVLTQSIQFSPAYQLDTVEESDVGRVYNRLLLDIANDRPIPEIVYNHMISQENWRRFRSPEDNTREMMEIFLQHYNDDDVPPASMACINWSIDDKKNLVIDNYRNTEPVIVMGREIISCEDFYQLIVQDNRLIPTTTRILIDYFFDGAPEITRQNFTEAIINKKPTTYRDIFMLIIFSRAYLLGAQRTRTIEESLFNTAARVGYVPYTRFFRDLSTAQHASGQAPYYYKLGRLAQVPVDHLSMTHFHNAVREKILLDRKTNPTNLNDGGWQGEVYDNPMIQSTYLRYLFLSILEREPSSFELDEIENILRAQGLNSTKHRPQIARIIFDYASRLPEFYVHRPVMDSIPNPAMEDPIMLTGPSVPKRLAPIPYH